MHNPPSPTNQTNQPTNQLVNPSCLETNQRGHGTSHGAMGRGCGFAEWENAVGAQPLEKALGESSVAFAAAPLPPFFPAHLASVLTCPQVLYLLLPTYSQSPPLGHPFWCTPVALAIFPGNCAHFLSLGSVTFAAEVMSFIVWHD